MMPMGSDFAGHDGKLSDEHIKYYELRARGGTGLIMVENVCVKYPEGSNGTTQLRLDKDCYIPRLFTLTEACHRQGALMGIQINHAGASAMSSRIGMQPVSASRFPSKAGGESPRGLSKEEIASIAKDYGTAAKRAVNAGFDVVEIHAGHSYLISQFLSPTTNKRTDEFGGSVENRTRFCRMVIEEVRKQVGPFSPIMLRLSADEMVEGGNTLEDGWRSYMPRAVKERFGKPCISMGNIRDPEVAEKLLADGDADLIGMGRGLIADPEWVNKVATGHECDIRKCISWNIVPLLWIICISLPEHRQHLKTSASSIRT